MRLRCIRYFLFCLLFAQLFRSSCFSHGGCSHDWGNLFFSLSLSPLSLSLSLSLILFRHMISEKTARKEEKNKAFLLESSQMSERLFRNKTTWEENIRRPSKAHFDQKTLVDGYFAELPLQGK